MDDKPMWTKGTYSARQGDTLQGDNGAWYCPICLQDTYWCECTEEDYEAYMRDIHPMRDE